MEDTDSMVQSLVVLPVEQAGDPPHMFICSSRTAAMCMAVRCQGLAIFRTRVLNHPGWSITRFCFNWSSSVGLRQAHCSAQVGGDVWNAQQDALQRLAAHMHASVAAGSDEAVKEALVRHGKLDSLVHLLLVFEVKRAWTLPLTVTV